MKKTISFFLAIVMMLGFCTFGIGTVCANAVESVVAEFPQYGFQYVYPDAYMNAGGILRWVIFSDSQIGLFYMKALSENPEEKESDRELWNYILDNPVLTVAQVFGDGSTPFIALQLYDVFPEQTTAERATQYVKDNSVYYSGNIGTLVSNTGWCYELEYSGMPEYQEREIFQSLYEEGIVSEQLAEEVAALHNDVETFISGFQLLGEEAGELTFVPASGLTLSPDEKSGYQKIYFETTDLEGNPVTSDEIFANHKVTMINIWATWCEPCVKEIPNLDELNQYFGKQNCQVIGICDDATSGNAGKALGIITDAGATYLNLTCPDNRNAILPSDSIPTTYFVDSEGNVLVRPIVRDWESNYARGLNAALAELGE